MIDLKQIMKKIILFMFFANSSISSWAQSLFFDNLNNSVWRSEVSYNNDTTIRSENHIGLYRLRLPADSLKDNATIWEFKNKVLTIKHYNYQKRKYSLIGVFTYQTDPDKGILKLSLNEGESIEYEVGITSTGNYVDLGKRKIKGKR